jgi:hypothetical protein
MERCKPLVGIARNTIWIVLMKQVAYKHADSREVTCSFFTLACRFKVRNLQNGVSPSQFGRNELGRLGIGANRIS